MEGKHGVFLRGFFSSIIFKLEMAFFFFFGFGGVLTLLLMQMLLVTFGRGFLSYFFCLTSNPILLIGPPSSKTKIKGKLSMAIT